MGFPIAFSSTQCPPPDIAIVNDGPLLSFQADLATAMAELLVPTMRSANFNTATFDPALLKTFSSPAAGPAALPWLVGEVQFYVNEHRVKSLGLQSPPHWTWIDVTTAVQAAHQRDQTGNAPLIIGEGWASMRMWGALVTGLGAQPLSGDGMLEVINTIDETAAIVALAREAHWDPNPTYEVGTPAADFIQYGFARSAADAVIAFAQPWTISAHARRLPSTPFGGGTGPKMVNVLSQCLSSGACSLVPKPFPLLPAKPVVPCADGLGLTVDPRTNRLTQAVTFLKWLYGSAQQAAAIHLGIPPVVQDPAVRAQWAQARTSKTLHLPLLDAGGYLDFLAEVPAGETRVWAWEPPDAGRISSIQPVFSQICQNAYQGANVADAFRMVQPQLKPAQIPTEGAIKVVEKVWKECPSPVSL